MANISGFFGNFFLKAAELWRDQQTLLIVGLSFSVLALLIAVYSAFMHQRRLKKLRRILQNNQEYARLSEETRKNLWAMEKIIVSTLSGMSKKDKKKISYAFQLDGSKCRQGLRKIMDI
jgi:uncharacterized membrane protein YcjF (UPF0283 family)